MVKQNKMKKTNEEYVLCAATCIIYQKQIREVQEVFRGLIFVELGLRKFNGETFEIIDEQIIVKVDTLFSEN